jgi:uncharacterized phage protein (TIGR01671 family)
MLTQIPQYRAYNKRLKKMRRVLDISLDPEFGGVFVWGKASYDADTGEHEADKDFWPWDNGNVVLMQALGFNDSEGTEVHDDDIIESFFSHPVKGPYTRKAQVVYVDFRWWYQMLDSIDCKLEICWIKNGRDKTCKVVGNIWENPELKDIDFIYG